MKAIDIKPGSLWAFESSHVVFVKIAQQGQQAVCISISKSTGRIISIALDSWIGEDCKPLIAQEAVPA